MPSRHLTRVTLLALAALSASDLGHEAVAEQRRALRRSKPVPTARAAPDVTSTIPAPKPTVPPVDDSVLKPYYLPAAPRSHMRACGEKWQAVKLAGQAADQTWRDFATKCLTDMEAEPKTTR